ncbi:MULTISPECIES: TetR/AcrR family transcriptional regulator [unclassified Corallococcus]|uniref:TetR/AcrR family transcriptional regulator n=1 Tax=unclassified Corallococcus TaxID=2685029 RepID=UPI001A8CC6BB|nr:MULTISPECIES: TetR/AcrR family transcriptional regulator [unclassified Corallococcus]MBN9682016.1 TetR family transcriptional regulator [Corallococcus sp. NCSPR001]WAS86420.1 TetR/AcrR family transcriptional regulator [Corallococcus sp. NCRR]
MPPKSAARKAEAPVRRTQAERRESTRRKLLDATIETLVEQGYARLTTVEVAKRAGVSQGALFTHFETKEELLAVAVEHLFPRLIQDFLAGVGARPSGKDRVGAAVDMLWAAYQRPELQAAIELYVAARTSPELQRALAVVDGPHRQNMHRVARELFPDVAATHPDFDDVVELALDAVQGAAVGGAARPSDPAHRRMLDTLARFMRVAFAPKD